MTRTRTRTRPLPVPDLARRSAAELGRDLPATFDPRDDAQLEIAAGSLLQRFRQHDDVAAYTQLVELCQDRLRALAERIRCQVAVVLDPDDLVAGFMARLFTDVRKDQPVVQRFFALAYTTMRYDALNQLRLDRRARRRGARWQTMLVERRRPVDPVVELDERERVAALPRLGALFLAVVGRCYRSLKARERRILHAREVLGLSYDEIAASLGLPRPQVGMILKRARQRLADHIEAALSAVPRAADAPSRGGRRPRTRGRAPSACYPSRTSRRRPAATLASDPMR